MTEDTPTRRSKIAGLPLTIREELCHRMLDGHQGPELLPWLNELPETKALLAARWEGDPVSASNLSDWRLGGYQDWLKKRERLEKIHTLANFCRKAGEAGAGELGLPAALAGGLIMEVLEKFDSSALTLLLAEKPEKSIELVIALAKLQSSQEAAKRGRQNEVVLKQRERQLDQKEREIERREQEFQRKSCELFVKWAADQQALAIASGKGKPAVKVDQLMLRMFGPRPDDKLSGGAV